MTPSLLSLREDSEEWLRVAGASGGTSCRQVKTLANGKKTNKKGATDRCRRKEKIDMSWQERGRVLCESIRSVFPPFRRGAERARAGAESISIDLG